MTKKDYIAIANVIDKQTEFGGSVISKTDLIASLINLFSADNPRFNAGKFCDACQTSDNFDSTWNLVENFPNSK